jgi:hypothetical protein
MKISDQDREDDERRVYHPGLRARIDTDLAAATISRGYSSFRTNGKKV